MGGVHLGRALPSRTPLECCRMTGGEDGARAVPPSRHATKFQGPGIQIPGGGAQGGSAPSQAHTHR